MYLHGTIGTDSESSHDGPRVLNLRSTTHQWHIGRGGTDATVLWFASWTPTSLGTTIAVCVGIFTLSMLERYLASLRRMFEANWTEETSSRLAIKRRSTTHATLFSSDIELQETEKNEQQQPLDPYGPGESIDQDEGSSSQSGRKMHMKGGGRTIHIPFRLGVDLPRGLFQALQTLLAYLLM